MAWTTVTADSLTLTGTYQTIQAAAVDMVTTLNPGELAYVQVDFNPQATPTENLDLVIIRSGDGTTYETPGEGLRYIVEYSNREAEDPAIRGIQISGCKTFKIQARLRTPSDGAGGADTTSTVDIDVSQDGVSI